MRASVLRAHLAGQKLGKYFYVVIKWMSTKPIRCIRTLESTPLHNACNSGKVQCVEVLLRCDV